MEFWTELVNTHLQFYDYIDSRVSFYDSDPGSDPPDFSQIVLILQFFSVSFNSFCVYES